MMRMYQNCERAVKITIPAIRVAVFETLREKHKMRETEIAKGLGIAQAAVSKYSNGKYSKKINLVKKAVLSRGLEKGIVHLILLHKGPEKVNELIDKTASNMYLVDMALKS
jgi:predicted transcriptional regulator